MTNEFTVGKFIGDLTNAYTRGTNKKYGRSGVIFESRTKSKLITDENYFIWLCKYILNNPVKAGLAVKSEDWEYSSAKEYFGLEDTKITEKEEMMKRFSSVEEFALFINTKEVKFDYSLLF